MKTTTHSRGFTLIELLVVIAIIGILSSVVLASLNSARQKGRDARRISDLKQLQLALELYYDASSQLYPITNLMIGTAPTLTSTLTPTYISTMPTDPTITTPYFYTSTVAAGTACNTAGSGCGSSYVLRAVTENATPSGAFTGTWGGVNCATANFYCVRP